MSAAPTTSRDARDTPSAWLTLAAAVIVPTVIGCVSYGVLNGDVAALRRDIDRIELTKASNDTVSALGQRLVSIESKLDTLIADRADAPRKRTP